MASFPVSQFAYCFSTLPQCRQYLTLLPSLNEELSKRTTDPYHLISRVTQRGLFLAFLTKEKKTNTETNG